MYQLKNVTIAPSRDPGGGIALAFHFYKDGRPSYTVLTRKPYADTEFATLTAIIEDCGAYLDLYYANIPHDLAHARTTAAVQAILRIGTRHPGAH